ncbi:sigma-70 family RNA polymerase sigma factor [Nocardiopsis sp. NPDC006198]|uniref:sigma-70 family RNA polymerase sigma factor n=1 Tax=Nocardiopsis sp. NPDC006198 TaxID=3154472 RepID=UPI0033B085E9
MVTGKDGVQRGVVATPPGSEQVRAAIQHLGVLRDQGVRTRVVARGRVLRRFVESLLSGSTRREEVLAYHRFVRGLWGSVLGTAPVELDRYRVDLTEFLNRVVRVRTLPDLGHEHLVLLQGQELPEDFYSLLRLLGVPYTVFVDPTLVVGAEGTTLDELCRLAGTRSPVLLDRPNITTAEIHEFSTWFQTGPKTHTCRPPTRRGPRPVLTHHSSVGHEAHEVRRITDNAPEARVAVILPTSELVAEFRWTLAPYLPGRLQWYISGEDIRYDERVDGIRPGLRILTWSSAFGLDFDVVVLAGLQEVLVEPDSTVFTTSLRALSGLARSALWLSFSGEGVPEVVEALPRHLLDSGETFAAPAVSPAEEELHPEPDEAGGETQPRGEGRATSAQVEAARGVISRDSSYGRPDKYVLTADEEVGLFQLIRGEGQPLEQELPRYFRSRLEPDDARAVAFDAMILHNQGLLHSNSLRYLGQGLEQEDLVNHGVSGLVRAVEKFDATKGHKFSTYATWWLKQAMSRAVADESRVIRLPVHMHEQVRRVQAVRASLAEAQKDTRPEAISHATDLTVEEVVKCLRLARGIVSLDLPLGDEEFTLADVIPIDPDSPANPDTVVDTHGTAELVAQARKSLTERESLVLGLRFGLDGDEPMTLEVIGVRLGVTRERVRQIERVAKERLSEVLTQVVSGTGEILVELAETNPFTRGDRGQRPPARSTGQVRAPIRSRGRRKAVTTLVDLGSGTDLRNLLGAGGQTSGSVLLTGVVELCAASGTTSLGIDVSPAGTPLRLSITHDGPPMLSAELVSLPGMSPFRNPSTPGHAVLASAVDLFDEVEVWDERKEAQPFRRLLLNNAPRTDNWWLRGDDSQPPVALAADGARGYRSLVVLRGARPDTGGVPLREAIENLGPTLGLVLGNLIQSRGLSLSLNGQVVRRRDPFAWRNPSTQDLGTEVLYSDRNAVRVTPFVLPHPDHVRPEDEYGTGPPESWEASQGFYVLCEGRYLSCSGWLDDPDLTSTSATSLARILVEIQPGDREAWGASGAQGLVSPPSHLRSRLSDLAGLARERSALVFANQPEASRE